MNRDYLTLSSYKDLKNKKDRIIYRSLETLPAFLSWGTFLLMFIYSWSRPLLMAIFVIAFDCFWLLKVLYLATHQTTGYKIMKRNLKIDWTSKIRGLKNWRNVYHLVILPMYKEDLAVIRPSLQSLAEIDYPRNKIMLVLAVEERGGKEALETAKLAEKEFAKYFHKFLITVHPKDIVGEIAGKGSNVNWALKEVKEKLINKLNIPTENIMVSNFDIDTRPFPQYFSILTWNFLTVKDPLKCSYQPIPIYNNNIWQVPSFSRLIATSGTFWQMMQQERADDLVSYSSHSLPFKVLDEVGFPKNIVSDDSRIFWKSYLAYNGDYRVVPLYYPVSMDAVLAESSFKTAINQYKQQRRWAWGCENIPYLLFGFLKNKEIPFKKKLRHSLTIVGGFWTWAVAALLIFFLGWLPLMLGGGDFKSTLISYNLPRMTSTIMTMAMVGVIISAAFSMLLLPPRPEGFGKGKSLVMILQWLLMPFTLILFGSFPALESQTRLAIGKRLGFWVTDKVSK